MASFAREAVPPTFALTVSILSLTASLAREGTSALWPMASTARDPLTPSGNPRCANRHTPRSSGGARRAGRGWPSASWQGVRPRAEHLPRSHRVQLLHIVEEQDADTLHAITLPCSAARCTTLRGSDLPA